MEDQNIQISVATTDEEIMAAFDLMQQLRPHLKKNNFVGQIRLQEKEGYRLVTVKRTDLITAVAGVRLTNNLAMGRHVYVDDLVTLPEERSKGFGKRLMDWIEDFARENECSEVHLDSGVQRFAAHRFYFRERMNIVFYHFSKKL